MSSPRLTSRCLSAILVILTVTLSGDGLGQNQTNISNLPQAPAWELYSEQGTLVKSTDFTDTPIILHFWATWCPYCKRLQPGLDKLYRKYRERGLQMIAVSILEDNDATPQAELLARNLSFKTLVHGEAVALLFQVQGTPTTLFINRQGQVVASTQSSDPDDPRLEQAVKSLFGH